MNPTSLDRQARDLVAILAERSVRLEHDDAVALLRERRDALRASAGISASKAAHYLDDATLRRIAAVLAREAETERARTTAWDGPAHQALPAGSAARTAARIGQALLRRDGGLHEPDAVLALRCMTGFCEALARHGTDEEVLVPTAGLALAQEVLKTCEAAAPTTVAGAPDAADGP